MRIGIGQLWQETNTFNPLPTTREDFEQFGVLRGAEIVERMADTNELGGFIQSLRRLARIARDRRPGAAAGLAERPSDRRDIRVAARRDAGCHCRRRTARRLALGPARVDGGRRTSRRGGGDTVGRARIGRPVDAGRRHTRPARQCDGGDDPRGRRHRSLSHHSARGCV